MSLFSIPNLEVCVSGTVGIAAFSPSRQHTQQHQSSPPSSLLSSTDDSNGRPTARWTLMSTEEATTTKKRKRRLWEAEGAEGEAPPMDLDPAGPEQQPLAGAVKVDIRVLEGGGTEVSVGLAGENEHDGLHMDREKRGTHVDRYFTLALDGNMEGNAGALSGRCIIDVLGAMGVDLAARPAPHAPPPHRSFLDLGCSSGRLLVSAISSGHFHSATGYELPGNASDILVLHHALTQLVKSPASRVPSGSTVGWIGADINSITAQELEAVAPTHIYSFWESIPESAVDKALELIRDCKTAQVLALSGLKKHITPGENTTEYILRSLGRGWRLKDTVPVVMKSSKERKWFYIFDRTRW